MNPAPTDQETRVPFFKVRASKTMLDALTSMRRGDVALDEFNRMLEWVIQTHMSTTRRLNGGSNPL
jgi:hypothetical protein